MPTGQAMVVLLAQLLWFMCCVGLTSLDWLLDMPLKGFSSRTHDKELHRAGLLALKSGAAAASAAQGSAADSELLQRLHGAAATQQAAGSISPHPERLAQVLSTAPVQGVQAQQHHHSIPLEVSHWPCAQLNADMYINT